MAVQYRAGPPNGGSGPGEKIGNGISIERARAKRPRSICLKMVALQCVVSTVCDDLLVVFEDVWSKRTVLHCLLSRVCDDLRVAFEDVWWKSMVLHCHLRMVL